VRHVLLHRGLQHEASCVFLAGFSLSCGVPDYQYNYFDLIGYCKADVKNVFLKEEGKS